MHGKKEKKDMKSVYMGIFIAFIMITSAFAVIFYGFTSGTESVRYKKYKFIPTELGYEAKIGKETYYFNNVPQDVEMFNVSNEAREIMVNAQAVAITSEANSSYKGEIAIAEAELQGYFTKNNKYAIIGFTQEEPKYPQVPAITCMNSTYEMPVILIEEGDSTEVNIEDSCIKVRFDTTNNLMRINSKIIFILLGVMNE